MKRPLSRLFSYRTGNRGVECKSILRGIIGASGGRGKKHRQTLSPPPKNQNFGQIKAFKNVLHNFLNSNFDFVIFSNAHCVKRKVDTEIRIMCDAG